MRVVVITGCQGFIAQYLTGYCLSHGWRVYGIDKMTYAACEDVIVHPNFKFIKEDIADLKILPDCDYVFNVAAESHVGNSIISSKEFIHTNVEGTRNLLDLVKNKPLNVYGRPHFFHFSTDEVYGDRADGFFTEKCPLNPSNPYSASKAAADQLIKAWARTYDLKYSIVRPTNNYGLGQFPEKLIPGCIKILQAGKKVKLHNRGEPIRSWLHASDTANAVLSIVDAIEKDPDLTNNIWNIGGEEKKNKDVVKEVIQLYFEDPKVNWKEHVDLSFVRPGQDVRYAVDDSKLRSIGWEPKANFSEKLKDIVHDCKVHFRW